MATYYVDGAVGNDSNAGTSEGAGNAWATIQQAADTVAAGDTVYIKASATYNEQVTLTTVGGFATPITWEGYSSTTGDGGVATISGGGTRTSCVTGVSKSYQRWKNIKLDSAASSGYNDSAADHVTFINCTFSNNGYIGAVLDLYCQFYYCTLEGNGNSGSVTDGRNVYVCCISRNNGNDGIYGASVATYNCLCHGNTNSQIHLGTYGYAFNCTVDGEGGATTDGINSSSTYQQMVAVNIIIDAGNDG